MAKAIQNSMDAKLREMREKAKVTAAAAAGVEIPKPEPAH